MMKKKVKDKEEEKKEKRNRNVESEILNPVVTKRFNTTEIITLC